jgi:hypothetical protein
MDRSFLSQPEVIAASRQFVCVRLTTYEDREENDFLKALWVGRSGEVENTLFTLLSPDGKRTLVHPSRSTRQAFVDAEDMAKSMRRIAAEFEPRPDALKSNPPLPLVANVRLALDVAACDDRPLLVLRVKDADAKTLEGQVAALAWSEEFLGQFVYVRAASFEELGPITGGGRNDGVLIVEPDVYGTKGKVLREIASDEVATHLAKALRAEVSKYQRRDKDFHDHVRKGQLNGIFWETALPVTDPMEKRARERGRERKSMN